MSSTAVSVVIPCHDAEAHLAQAIGSALDQTRPPDEVIVVDDGSTDDSVDIALRFQARFPDRVMVRSHGAGSATRTRNLGAYLASGDALLFLDADDVLAPGTLEALIGALQRRPDGVAACPWFRLVESDGRWIERPPSCTPRLPGDDPLNAWLTGWYHPPAAVLWSRDAFERAGRWDERCASNQDGDLMMRALVSGVPLSLTTEGAAYYRRPSATGASLSGQRFSRRGVVSRIRAVRKVVAALEDQGRLADHAAAIHEAFTSIATELCRDHPDLREEALSYARRFGPGPLARWRRRWRRTTATLARRLRGRARQLPRGLARRLTKRPRPAPVEVRYGLHLAEAALATPPAATDDLKLGLDRPLVSVVVPSYNREQLISRAVDSALTQTMDDLEVLVVDDGSVDATAEVVAAYDDERVRYLPQPENRGVSAARNRGLREARGEFVAFLDSDDEWLPDKLAVQMARFRDLPEDVGLLYGAVENHDGRTHRDTHVPTHRGDVYERMLTDNVIHGTSSVVMRRSVVATVGFFDEGIPAIEDYDYWLRASRFFDVDHSDRPVSRYHDPDADERKSRNVPDNLAARAWFYRKHASKMREAGVAHHFLLKSVRRHLAHDDEAGARALAVRAIGHAPTSPTPYRRLVGTFTPRWVKRLLHGPQDGSSDR